LIFINNIVKNKLNGEIFLFADDAIIIYDFQSNNDMHKLIQEDLLLLKQWYSSYGLTMNYSKTEYIVFSRKEFNLSRLRK